MTPRAAVFVATTEGPCRILRLVEAPHQRQSAACLNLRTRKAGISGAYHDFVSRECGIVARATGRDAYRLDLSADIGAGESWQLGVFVAHGFAHVGRLAPADPQEPEDLRGADLLVWASGEVDSDLRVRRIESLERKLVMSDALFRKAREAGIPVRLLLPAANRDAALEQAANDRAGRDAGLEWCFLERVTFGVDGLAGDRAAAADDAAPPEPSGPVAARPGRLRRAAAVGVVALVAASLFALGRGPLRSQSPTTPASGWIAPAATASIVLADDGHCFGATTALEPQSLEWQGVHRIDVAGRPCRLELTLQNPNATNVRVDVLDSATGATLESRDLRANDIVEVGIVWYSRRQGSPVELVARTGSTERARVGIELRQEAASP